MFPRIVLAFFNQCQRALDLVYAEAIAVGRDNLSDDPSHSKAVDEERQAISEEIQSLWEEVIPVAHMAVEKEFLKPFLKEVDHAAKDAKLRNSTISAYVRNLSDSTRRNEYSRLTPS